jgi:hypothetical protein
LWWVIGYHYGMQRTTVMLPEELAHRLRQIAAERGTSMAALLREAAEEQARRYRPHPRSLGIGDSGHTDTARRTGDERPIPRPWR